jgi:hypothetical protein
MTPDNRSFCALHHLTEVASSPSQFNVLKILTVQRHDDLAVRFLPKINGDEAIPSLFILVQLER